MFRILVVEDDKELNKTVCSFLNHSGYEATGCLNGNEAYDALYENIFDLIVSDIMMPGVDGFEFARNVRELNEDIPNRTFHHHEITTIALAAYTFGSLTMAIVNVVKYRKYNSPVYSASKAISLAAACVSMLTLESTMLTTFGEGTMDLTTRKIMLGVSGGAISVFIIFMAMHMIAQGTKKIKLLDAAKEQQNG